VSDENDYLRAMRATEELEAERVAALAKL